jgi:hypothetical protein
MSRGEGLKTEKKPEITGKNYVLARQLLLRLPAITLAAPGSYYGDAW